MNCRSCNTRLPSANAPCPNCGHSQGRSGFIDGKAGQKAAPPKAKAALSPSIHQAEPPQEAAQEAPEEVVELSLEAAVGREAESAPRSPSTSYRSASPRRKKKPAQEPAAPAPATSPVQTATPDEPLFPPSEVRAMVCADPELLEPGLEVHRDEADHPIGAGFETDVGEIDLLARDDAGGWVVVMVLDGQPDRDTLPSLLHRMGWVRKHLIKSNQGLRAILILERMDDELGYAAAAIADAVEFRTCQVQVSFTRVEV